MWHGSYDSLGSVGSRSRHFGTNVRWWLCGAWLSACALACGPDTQRDMPAALDPTQSPMPTGESTPSSGAPGSDAGGPESPPTSTPPTTPDASSHGAGGVPCTRQMTQNQGLDYCLGKVGTVEYKLFVPEDGSKRPMQMALFLHGDTANGYLEDWGFEALAAWASQHHVLMLAALAPNGCSWWRPETSCSVDEYDTGGNALALEEVLKTIAKGYDVYQTDLLYVGYSGGSTFLTRQWIPMFGDTHPGVVVANCGGVEPQAFSWEPSDLQRARVPLYYTYGDSDFMIEYILPSSEQYDALGFPVSLLELRGVDHCGSSYDWDERTLSLWSAALLD